MRDRLTSLIAIALLVTLCAMSYWYSVKAELENVTHLSDLNSPDLRRRIRGTLRWRGHLNSARLPWQRPLLLLFRHRQTE